MKVYKILYLSSVDFSEDSGCSINEFEFCISLYKIFTNNAFFAINIINNQHKNSLVFLQDENFMFYKPKKLSKILDAFKIACKIFLFIKKNNIDFVVTRLFEPPIVVFILQSVFNLKVAVKTAGTTYINLQSLSVNDKIYTFIDKWLRIKVQKKSFCVDTPTDELAHLVYSETSKKDNLHIVGNATNTDFFRPINQSIARKKYGFNANDFILGFIGSAPSEDGGMHMIAIIKKIIKDNSKTKIVIVGEDAGLAELKRSTVEKQLKENVIFLGKRPYKEMPEIISTFNIGFSFVPKHILMRNGNSSQKTRQYLSCGIPVITIKKGHEFIDTNPILGYVVEDPDDYESIYRATVCIMQLYAEGSSLLVKQKIRDYAVKHLSMDSVLKYRLAIWQSILNKK